jgi:hypothetical protein
LQVPSVYDAERHRKEALAIAAPGAAVDATGLIGRNGRYGKMVSPRLQLGSGAALGIGLHADRQMAINGFRAIEVGTQAIAADGEVVSVTPPDAPVGAELSISDKARGAAFFMADACPAVLTVRASPDAEPFVDKARRDHVIAALDRGLRWLMQHAGELERVDRRAPNRLLYDALAYHSCGVLMDNKAAQTLATRFAALALSQTRKDGVFV